MSSIPYVCQFCTKGFDVEIRNSDMWAKEWKNFPIFLHKDCFDVIISTTLSKTQN
jgi:hypothetical protein